ncbi:hypothetical protein [Streptomyces sp. NPDC048282]
MRSGRSPTGVRRGSLDRLTATATGSTADATATPGSTPAAPAAPRVP